MAVFLGLLTGILISVMNYINSDLSVVYGNYFSIIIIHAVGLLFIIPISINKIKKSTRKVPLWCYTGGIIGVVTTFACNVSIIKLGVTLAIALCLLGQTATSTIIDQFGAFGRKKYPINKRKMASICLIAVGTVVMIIW